MKSQVTYLIRIKGQLGNEWSDWFDGLTITTEPGGESLIAGPVRDQAALFGLLLRVHDLGLELLSVNSQSRKDQSELLSN